MDKKVKRYELDRARIILERFEEETVLVNIESGYYYSVSSAGSEILELLEEGLAADDLAPALFGDSETLHRFQIRIAQFVEKLAVEGSVVERDPQAAQALACTRDGLFIRMELATSRLCSSALTTCGISC